MGEKVLGADTACPRCDGTGGDYTPSRANTQRPADLRPTVRVAGDGPATRSRSTLEAVAHAALTRAFDVERSSLAVRANAERLRGLSADGPNPGVKAHWSWLAAQNLRVAEALTRVASAERELSEAARAVAEFLREADAAIALIAPQADGTTNVQSIPAASLPVEARETLSPPPRAEGT